VTAACSIYLRLLYPTSRFLFLFDDPYESYRASLAACIDTELSEPALTATSFATQWLDAVASFLRYQERVGAALWSLEAFLAAPSAVLKDRLGFTVRDSSPEGEEATAQPRPLTNAEQYDIWTRVGPSQGALARHGIMVRSPDYGPAAAFTTNGGLASRAKCAILIPVARYVEPDCEFALRELERRGYALRWFHGCSAIDAARSRLATIALDEGFDETMWVDTDVAFDPDDVDRLRSHSRPIVCGIYPRKGARGVPARLLPGRDSLTFGEAGGLIEIQYAPAGFLLVRREVYVGIQERLSLPVCHDAAGQRSIPFFMPMVENEGIQYRYLGEDYAFSQRARLAGHKVYADTTIRLWHIGPYRYSFEDTGEELTRFRSYQLSIRPR
jgi:hypothetical protein